jgi:spore coat protein H
MRVKRCWLMWLSVVLWFIATPGSGVHAATNDPTFFGLTNLWTLHLTIPPQDWDLLGSRGGPQGRGFGGGGGGGGGGRPESPGLVESLVRGILGGGGNDSPRPQRVASNESESSYPWATCTFEAAGQRLTNVAVRFKGVSSMVRSPNAYKRPFKLDFDRGSKDRSFYGLEELYLNNNVNDATQMREALAYELFRRAGLPAPRTAFARVFLTIPGRIEKQHLGLYTLVEVVEGGFLKRHFAAKDGLLLKPAMMRGLPYLGDDWDAYVERYEPKGKVDPQLAEHFIGFTRFIRESEPEAFGAHLRDYLDTDRFLRFVALNALLANVDSFIGNGHNYFLHVHPTNRIATFIPWDVNEAFGMHPVSGASGDQMKTSILRPNADPNPLVERCLRDPQLAARYRAHCAQLLTNVFVARQLHADIVRIAAVTQPVVFAETRRAKEDFQRTVLGTMRPDEGDTHQPRHDREYAKDGYRPWGFPDAVEIDNIPLKEWITGREANARGQLEGRIQGTRPRPRLFQQ